MAATGFLFCESPENIGETALRTDRSDSISDHGNDPGHASARPDLRSKLSRLPADLPEHGRFLLRVRIHDDGAVYGVSIGPRGAVCGQSVLRRAADQAQQAQKATQQLLMRALQVP